MENQFFITSCLRSRRGIKNLYERNVGLAEMNNFTRERDQLSLISVQMLRPIDNDCTNDFRECVCVGGCVRAMYLPCNV